MDPRLCLICRRPQGDTLHGAGGDVSELHDWAPEVGFHAYDPGERRVLVRRMDDRIHKIEDAVRRVER
ncbi:MAG TPA: hypothetical protein VK600_01260 [Candidatus Saccharimonadales bacterium]|nr:hypothetical protein [Candidatus Saccharimonadales bacterium]